MIVVRCKRSAFDCRDDLVHRVEWDGQSVLELAREFWRDEWTPQMRVAALVNGGRVAQEDLGLPLADEVDVTLGPDPQGLEFFGLLLLSALLSAGASWAYSKLVGVPQPDPGGQARGEDESRTYAWDQIRSEYRAGFPVPLLYGEHDIGPQVIYASVSAPSLYGGSGPYEVLRVILALGGGRIHSIGGVTGNALGEADFLGGFIGQGGVPGGQIPADIRIDGNTFDVLAGEPGVRAFVRMGTDDQSPLPPGVFPGAAQTDTVNGELRDLYQRVVHPIVDPEVKTRLELIFAFPGGLYSIDSQGNFVYVDANDPVAPGQTGVRIDVEFRQGDGAWQRLDTHYLVVPPTQAPFARTVAVDLTGNGTRAGIVGDMEVRVTRYTAAPGGQTLSGGIQSDRDVSACVWRQVSFFAPQQFSYPGVALLGLEVQATEQTTAKRNNFVLRCKGAVVRIWDATIGVGSPSATRYYELPEVGDPYFGIWSYPPGKNPAWVLADFLTTEDGLGRWLTDADIDWPAFRNWADFCDQDALVDGSPEAAFCYDGPIDAPRPGWQHVIRICKAGRAVPVIKGSKISIKYAFADAHGRGTNSVPAKARVALVTTNNVRGLTTTYSNRRSRPATIQGQFLSRDSDYAQTLIPVDDPDGGHEDPSELNPLGYVKETVEFFGVTRPSQVVRECLFMHRTNGGILSEVSFDAGIDQLAAELGDVVGVQHDSFRPFGEQSFAARATAAGASSTSMVLDRAVTVTATTYVVFRDAADAIQEVAVASAPGAYPAGTPITLAVAHSWRRAAVVAIGEQNKVVVDYEIVSVTLAQDLTRRIEGVRWRPSLHTIDDVGPYLDTGASFARVDNPLDGQGGDPESVVTIRVTPSPVLRGVHVIGWESPGTGFEGRPVRVYTRLAGASTWFSLGEFRTGSCQWSFAAGEDYEVAVATANRLGVFQVAEVATQLAFTAEEFAAVSPPNVRGASVEYAEDNEAAVLRWRRIASADVVGYEVRRGPELNGAEVIGFVQRPELWTDRVEHHSVGDTIRFWIRALSSTGLYSSVPARVDLIAAAPSELSLVDDVELDLSALSSANLTLSQNLLTLRWSAQVAANVRGYVDSAVESSGSDEKTWTWIHADQSWSEDVLIGSLSGKVGSGESKWRLVSGRPASAMRPGAAIEARVGDFAAVRIGDADVDQARSRAGEAGERAVAVLWFRTAKLADIGTIGAQPWRRYTGPFRETFAAIQVRVELLRHEPELALVVADVRIKRWA